MLAIACSLALPTISQAAIVVVADGELAGKTPALPTWSPSATDLADASQSTYGSIALTGIGADAGFLNDGSIGVANDGERTQIEPTDAFTINFDTSVNTSGYDITGINSYAGWNTAFNGRSNQGYTVTVTYVNDSTEVIITGTHYANTVDAVGENGAVNHWTRVLMTDDTGTIATGVKAITFSDFDEASSGGAVQYREFDVIGTVAAVPEPSTFTMLGLGALGLISRRRR